MNGERSDFAKEAKSYLINPRYSPGGIDYFLLLFCAPHLSLTLSLFYKFKVVVVGRVKRGCVEKLFFCFEINDLTDINSCACL